MDEVSYVTGEVVCLGDIVELDGRKGRIVACIEGGQYSPAFPEKDWAYLKEGILWESPDMGVVHVSSLSEPGVVLIRRKHEDE